MAAVKQTKAVDDNKPGVTGSIYIAQNRPYCQTIAISLS